MVIEILGDKKLRAKQKTAALAEAFSAKKITAAELIEAAQKNKDVERAACLEAFEKATKTQPELADDAVWAFACASLAENVPSIKRESARLVGNIARLFPQKVGDALGQLFENSENSGTVVRWAAAFALGEILKIKTALNGDLAPALEGILEREEDNEIRKIYLDALKKAKK